MIDQNQLDTETATSTVVAYLEALSKRDFETVAELFAPNVWYRALLTRRIVDVNTADEALAEIRETLAGDAFVSLETSHHSMHGREFLSYRFLLRPEWAPDQWHVIEQSGYAKVADGRISRLDLACTGYWPVDAPDG